MKVFQKTVWEHYRRHGRHLPWRRKNAPPYQILVSEIMLQQTQVDRVIPYYKNFIKQFPNFKCLGRAHLKDVLLAWQGLGYNRRALNLKRTAEIVINDFRGRLPRDEQKLVALPGIGTYTARAIRTFAHNIPEVLIETNIRSVYIHHYYSFIDKTIIDSDRRIKISDKELLPLIEKTLDTKNPREWYAALMDYGSHLKKTLPNPNTQSAHYTKQSRFAGSRRELRGAVVRELTTAPHTPLSLAKKLSKNSREIRNILTDLTREGFIQQDGRRFRVA